MRYSSALVLGTLAVGQAAAANGRHAGFHARRSAEKKRADDWVDKVNWKDISYDLSAVDWSSVFASQATPTPTPVVTSAAVVQAAEVKATTTAAPVVTSAPKPKTSAAATTSASSGNGLLDIVNDLTAGLSSLCSKLGFIEPDAEGTANKIWKGEDSDWTINFVNQASESVTVFCWESENWQFSLNAYKALAGFTLAAGANETYSWAGGLSSACSAVYSDTGKSLAGAIHNTWLEVTFPNGGSGTGAFDVTRLPNMSGHSISAQGSKCLSDENTCVFVCNKIEDTDEDSCTYDYSLKNCDASNGGGGGIDAKYNAVGGGCSTANDAENIQVTFS